MANGTRTVRIRFDGDQTGLAKTAKAGERSLSRFGKKAESIGKSATASFLGNLGVDLVERAAAKVKNFVGESISGARESIAIGKQTNAVIKSTKGAANLSAKAVGDYATKLSNLTGVDDEVIQGGENMLLTFTNVRNGVGKGNDIFNQATKTLTDMSVALGSDPQKQAIQLGKALNDPIKGVSALSRVGVTFTAGQKKTIKSLVDSGKTMEAQKIILRELNKEFGGSAAAQTTAAQKAKVAFGNLQEQIGGYLVPVIDKFATFASTKLIPRLADLADKYGPRVVAEIKRIAARVSELASKYGPKLWDILKKVASVLQRVAGFIQRNQEVLKPLVVAVVAGVAAFQAVMAVTRAWIAVQAALNFVLTANPIGIVIVAVAALAAGIIYAYKHSETFREIVITVFKAVGKFVLTAIENILRTIGKFIGIAAKIPGPWQGAMKKAAKSIEGAADKVHGLNAALEAMPTRKTVALHLETGEFYARLNAAKTAVQGGGTVRPGGKRGPGYSGHVATGGHVMAGRSYLVGEHGPEIITPSSQAYVRTAQQTEKMLDAGQPIIVENHIEIGGEVVRVVRTEITADKRSTRRAVLSGAGRAT